MATTAEILPSETLDGMDAVCGVSRIGGLMHPYDEIPDEFKRGTTAEARKWREFQSDWFFAGIDNLEVKCKEGIDRHKALRHLAALNRSFAPKHEHKEAGVAYLASLWFDDVSYTRGKPQR